ncbi:hypothetical protein BpHYR1_040498 [Brachionus plicatilis]|uniref:Uncharacterized protein n=1 Tax=Brachionus plicatilis TaxID=10195 RepID=A0A3M7RJL8_BRAPC|nr:hypothetical protein BpHYR1_040498 [Brachionus plicatilis]
MQTNQSKKTTKKKHFKSIFFKKQVKNSFDKFKGGIPVRENRFETGSKENRFEDGTGLVNRFEDETGLIKIIKNRNLLFGFGYCFSSVGNCWPLGTLFFKTVHFSGPTTAYTDPNTRNELFN